MSKLQQNRYDELLRRVGNLKGPGSKVNDVLEELFPMFDVEHLQPENYLLRGDRLAYGGTEVPGVVAQFSAVQVFNPIGSGQIMVIEWLEARQSSSGLCRYGMEEVALTVNSGLSRNRDTRLGVTEPALGQLRTETRGVVLPPFGITQISTGGQDLQVPSSFGILIPGFGFTIVSVVANVDLAVTFFWRERATEESETNL